MSQLYIADIGHWVEVLQQPPIHKMWDHGIVIVSGGHYSASLLVHGDEHRVHKRVEKFPFLTLEALAIDPCLFVNKIRHVGSHREELQRRRPLVEVVVVKLG
jgi:hypothetical protein